MNPPIDLALHWTGPWSFRDLLINRDEIPGDEKPCVYLWLESLAGRSKVIYVGQSRRGIWKRQLEHYRCLIGGQYWLPPQSRHGQGVWNPNFEAKDTASILFDRSRFLAVVGDGFDYAQSITICFATVKDKPLLQVERNLIARWNPEQNVTVRLRDEEMLEISHSGIELPPQFAETD